MLIFAPFFHRDERNLDFAHSFSPEIWEEPRTRDQWPLMPFSAGTAICPGRHLVLLLTSNFLAEIIRAKDVTLTSHSLEPGSMPGLLNNFTLEFELTSPA
ncbi:cytochrome P450 [Nesterenkonia pannonica]|uniref:cytochrome P450 n=1 Tax=Nesterenkonia pannonica TaxID=1548602 RepID=UPI0021644683|nr:cytochrome P450 [Nesterenkonia pannonica]